MQMGTFTELEKMSSQVEYTPQSPKESSPPQQRPANLLSRGKDFLPLEGRIDITE